MQSVRTKEHSQLVADGRLASVNTDSASHRSVKWDTSASETSRGKSWSTSGSTGWTKMGKWSQGRKVTTAVSSCYTHVAAVPQTPTCKKLKNKAADGTPESLVLVSFLNWITLFQWAAEKPTRLSSSGKTSTFYSGHKSIHTLRCFNLFYIINQSWSK